ncbi:hypothetical protein B5V03_31650 [Bradyrhizobium betae]|uniref:Uncharacterized protein n=1 Tax=Bradyrhizobium betae TaxID=244734 RepID=A0A4V1P4D1_9BRAD|nr:hypothetical protein B5V03_31650 [Bradyrhizobium betae]
MRFGLFDCSSCASALVTPSTSAQTKTGWILFQPVFLLILLYGSKQQLSVSMVSELLKLPRADTAPDLVMAI